MYSIMSFQNETFAEFGGGAMRQSLEKLLEWAEKLAETPGEEPLHKLRVASRRCRAAFSVFDGVFPENELTKVSHEVTGVTDALGAARDLDVMLGWISKRMEISTDQQKVGLQSYSELKQSQRDGSQAHVSVAIEQLRKSEIQCKLDVLTGYDRPIPVLEPESAPTEPIVKEQLAEGAE